MLQTADFVASNDGSNIYVKIGDEIIQGTKTNATTITASTRGYDGTIFATHSNGATVELYQINGIPLDQVNKTHTALANIGIDSYTLATANSANASSNQGGSAVVVTENAMMDGMQTLLPTMLYPETALIQQLELQLQHLQMVLKHHLVLLEVLSQNQLPWERIFL